jgi:hypothetical protein
MSGTEGQGGATPTMLQYLQLLQGGLLEAMFKTGNVEFGLGDHALVFKDGISIMLASNPQKIESVGWVLGLVFTLVFGPGIKEPIRLV